MLVLTRRVDESIMIGDDIRIILRRISGNRVRLAIEAPDDVAIRRGELQDLGGKAGHVGVEQLHPLSRHWSDRRVS